MASKKRLLKKTDSSRRKATSLISKTLELSLGRKKTFAIQKDEVKKVLIIRPNHRLGNQLLITPLVKEVTNTFPNAKIDLFLKGNLGEVLFDNYPSVDKLIMLPKKHFKELLKYISGWFSLRGRKYDLIINVDFNSSSGRMSALLASGKNRLFEDQLFESESIPEDFEHFAKKSIYQLRAFLQKLDISNENKEIPSLEITLSEKELEHGKSILSKINTNDKPTIGIFTFATLDKCYEPKFWIPFYESLKSKYGNDYNIVEILPVENVSQINFIAPHFYSKDIRELASVMNSLEAFISADSGMMHLASAAQIPVIGLFKHHRLHQYQPYGNQSSGVFTEDLDSKIIFKELDRILN